MCSETNQREHSVEKCSWGWLPHRFLLDGRGEQILLDCGWRIGGGGRGGTTCDKGLSDNVLRRELASSSVRTGIFAWWFVSCFGNAMGHGCKASFTLDGPRSRLNHKTILERPAFLTDALAAGHTARKDIGKKSNLRNGGRVVENGAPRVCLYPDT